MTGKVHHIAKRIDRKVSQFFFFLILIRRSKHEFLDLFIIGFFSINKTSNVIKQKFKNNTCKIEAASKNTHNINSF